MSRVAGVNCVFLGSQKREGQFKGHFLGKDREVDD